MTRSLAALACFAALVGAPSASMADSWIGADSFYRPYWGGYGWGSYGTYTAGYAPSYYGYATGYAPWSYGGSCCSPCATSCCSPCGTGCGSACGTGCGSACGTGCGSACGTGCGTSCDPGCGNNCPGGNCATGSGTNTVPSTPADTGTGQPTYAPPTNPNSDNRNPPEDGFRRARPESPAPGATGSGTTGSGATVPSGSFGTSGGTNVGPNDATPFAPNNPSTPARPNRPNEDMGRAPKSLEPGEKVAFRTPARLTRSSLEPTFELPTIVKVPSSTRPEATPAPTAVASN